jgi:eukaryotic-like serine/threonine-protein kinase
MSDERIAGRYRLLEPLGRGAMSAVWLAEDEELGRRVAVKMLAPSADRERFEREARAVAALSHPNICGLYDYGEAEGRPFMVLEYLAGGSLEERLQGGPLADGESLRVATEVAAGLAHAHERGLVHRDLKPANILFDAEDRAKIADFGIARMGGTGTLTEAGTVLGTASYISPEQASGLPAGPASDVYSFGVILFRMLTGRLPFVSANAMELVRMHRDDPPPSIHELRPDAPARLESVAAAALAKDPAARPADGRVLLAELRGGDSTAATMVAAAAVPAAAEATQVIRRPPAARPSRRRVGPVAIVAIVLLLAGGALAIALTSGGGGGGGAPTSTPTLTLPTAPTAGSTTTEPTTTQPTTTEPTTTEPTTTTQATTTAPTSTQRTTTAPTTTAQPPTTTVVPPPPPTTTIAPPPTTDTVPTVTDVTTATTTPLP